MPNKQATWKAANAARSAARTRAVEAAGAWVSSLPDEIKAGKVNFVVSLSKQYATLIRVGVKTAKEYLTEAMENKK